MTLRASAARTDLLHGTLDMLILRTLQWGPQHGYAIGQTIRAQSSDVLQVEAGSLYPALQRLAKKGWVTSKWGQTEANQRAKFYRLTPEGKQQLLREESRWTRARSRDRPHHDTGVGTGEHRGLAMRILAWLKRLTTRRLDEDDFQDEIRAHLAIAADEHVAGGADREAARYGALKDFGNVTLRPRPRAGSGRRRGSRRRAISRTMSGTPSARSPGTRGSRSPSLACSHWASA